MSEKVQSPTASGETATQPVPQHETHSVSMAPSNGSQIEGKNEKKNGRKNFLRTQLADRSRRSFLSRAGGLTAMAVAAGIVPLEPLLGGKQTQAEASDITYSESNRSNDAFNFRKQEAQAEKISPAVAADNGDFALYTDHSGTWSKTLQHDNLGIVNQSSFTSFTNALTSTKFADFQNILVGNPGGTNVNAQMNGPQTALAFDLEGLDSHATTIDPSPTTASAQTADEEVEHYWAAMLRDVNFTDYPTNSTAIAAANELNGLTYIKGTTNNEYPFPVTPQNLFRGRIVAGDGNVQGPYLSQFLIHPTTFGALPLSMMFKVFSPNQNFMTSVTEYMNVENGFAPSASLAFDPTPRFLRNGRDLSSYTHVDVLHESYFLAFLGLLGLNVPLNPGNPYIGSRTEHGFGTLDAADCSATLPEVATRALKGAWFHKWIVNLRQRPEDYGALVHAHLTNRSPMPQAASHLHADVLNSQAVARTFSQFGTYLLPQAFPEGAPTHPCYPTGHGTVAGACITVLKYFFDCSLKIQPLLRAIGTDVMQTSEDGLSLVPYTGTDAANLTINGELSKLAHNISFGHGIHSGIHFRSSSRASILLGEQVGISVLSDRTPGYNEPFTINITKFDGTTQSFVNSSPGVFNNGNNPQTTCPAF
ncbi:MAG TPA: phosphoesterase [Candidatus Angelobacter sp.]|nr:phosphoesterase [Candidatus Angelobacter sp.]